MPVGKKFRQVLPVSLQISGGNVNVLLTNSRLVSSVAACSLVDSDKYLMTQSIRRALKFCNRRQRDISSEPSKIPRRFCALSRQICLLKEKLGSSIIGNRVKLPKAVQSDRIGFRVVQLRRRVSGGDSQIMRNVHHVN